MKAAHYDIIIVGGGLVGMALAAALRDHGFHIALLDAKPLPTTTNSTDGRSLALSYSSQQILTTLNLWKDIAPHATPIQTIHISRRGLFAKTRLHARDVALPALGYVVPAQFLAASIAKNVAQIPELTLYAPATVQGIEVKNKNAQIQVQHAGQAVNLSARLVIAADGSQSTIAKQLNIHQETHTYNQTAIVTTVRTSISNQQQAYERFSEQGVIALLPVREQEFGVVWTTDQKHAETLLALSKEDYLAELIKQLGIYWGTQVQLGERSSYPLTATRALEQIRPRVVILGNAAHTMHPVAAQGLNLALRSVAWLAETLVETTEDIGNLQVLHQYQQRVQSDQQRVQDITHGLVELTSDISSKPLWGLGLGLFDKIPGMKKLFIRQAAGLAGKQAKLVRGVELTH